MNTRRLQTILGMILATSTFGARGLYCGPCGGQTTRTVPILPPSADGGPGDTTESEEEACARLCPDADTCVATTITLPNGTMPALTCTDIQSCGGAGRRPEGLAEPDFTADRGTRGGWLARAAFLEEASVEAFRAIRAQLVAFGAPERLVRAASRAARDERRHSRRMRALARRHGARVPAPAIAGAPAASLEAFATHNAIEGCVRETFGALVATFQAQHATDRDIAAAMRKIARDETAHAALSWELARWAHARLAPEERARVEAARLRAITELRSELAEEPPREIIDRAGFPTAREAEVLLTVLLSG
jgi:rubrerythrin